MLHALTRTVVGLFWAGLAGYIVFDFAGKLSRHENPFHIVGFTLITLFVLQVLHGEVQLRVSRADSLSDLTYPYALVVMNAIVTYSWLELKAAPPFLHQYRLTIAVGVAVVVIVLLVFSYFYNKVHLPYIGQALVALALFAWEWQFTAWLWLSFSIFYSYGYEYARYLADRKTVRVHDAAHLQAAQRAESFPETFTALTLFTFTGLTLAWLQTTGLPYPTWAYWVVLTFFMLSLHASWLRFSRLKPISPHYFWLARLARRCIPTVLRP